MKNLVLSALIGATAAALTAAPITAAGAAPAHSDCFLSRDWQGWKSPAPDVIYLRVGLREIYRLDLSAGSNSLSDPGVHLVNRLRGSDWVCSPLDLQLSVADDQGVYHEPLIVKSITHLTPDEVRAIPPRDLP